MKMKKYEDMIIQATTVKQEKAFSKTFWAIFTPSLVVCSLVVMVVWDKPVENNFEQEIAAFDVVDDFLYLTSIEM